MCIDLGVDSENLRLEVSVVPGAGEKQTLSDVCYRHLTMDGSKQAYVLTSHVNFELFTKSGKLTTVWKIIND
jgi:sortase (surface protein transpeptidase)